MFDCHSAIHAATRFNGFLARGGGGGNSSLRDSTGQRGASRPRERQKVGVRNETRPHRADPGAAQGPARFGPRPGRTRQLCRPSHSAALIRSGERRCGAHLRGAFRFVPTAANWRDRPQIGRTQMKTSRMSRGSARHEQAIARDASHGQDIGNSREHGHFPTATLRWRSVPTA
jgi:hypothetical protein